MFACSSDVFLAIARILYSLGELEQCRRLMCAEEGTLIESECASDASSSIDLVDGCGACAVYSTNLEERFP